MKSPAVTDLSSLPVILTLKEIAQIYRVSEFTIRRGLQNGTFSPRPWDRYPYRWRRDDVALDLKRRRDEQPHKAHGFAATRTRRPAKATLDKSPTRVRSAR
jgi:hypothetical protein